MNYYSHHIGDFDRATRHLTRIERSVYLDLMFVYYDTEKPLTPDIAALCRKIVARSEDEKSAVLAVLDEFFVSTPSGWYHDRCEEELAKFREAKSQASAAGKASAAARAERRRAAMGILPTNIERRSNENPTTVERPLNERGTDRQRIVNETSTNHNPITNNQEPIQVNTNVPSTDRTPVEHAEVFDYWKTVMNHPKAKLDGKRERAIKGRLKDGYTVEQLCRAIDGCKATPYNMGQNRDGTVYDDIELICRNAPNTDRFIRTGSASQSGMSPGLQQQVDILQRWVEEGGE